VQIGCGAILCTFGEKEARGTCWRHIALGKFCALLLGKDVLAYDSARPQGKPAKRIFFNQYTMDDLEHRGWHAGGLYGV